MENHGTLALLATLLVTSPVFGAEPGFYIGAGMSQNRWDIAGFSETINSQEEGNPIAIDLRTVESDDKSNGFNVTLGYRLNKYFAAELAYMDFGSTSMTNVYTPMPPSSWPPFTDRVTSRVSGPAVTVLASVPLAQGFSAFVRGGVLFAEYDLPYVSYSDRPWIIGAGADWSFATRWSARLEYLQTGDIDGGYDSFDSQIDSVNLSILFKLK